MAQAYLGHAVLSRKLDLTVESAGTLRGDRAIAPSAVQVIGNDGLDMADHRSRFLDAEAIARSDLVLGMAREHVREVVSLDPSAWPRTFTLKELVRRGESLGGRSRGQSLSAWLEKIGADRRRSDLMGWSPADDVEDPIDGGLAVCRSTGVDLKNLVGRLVDLIEPKA